MVHTAHKVKARYAFAIKPSLFIQFLWRLVFGDSQTVRYLLEHPEKLRNKFHLVN